METLDLLKQLEINYKLISNDLEYSSHALDSFLKAAARYVFRCVMALHRLYGISFLSNFANGQNTTAVAGPPTPTTSSAAIRRDLVQSIE